jgi:DNA-binding transcriptional regulator/RsmH inhibitor MraZ
MFLVSAGSTQAGAQQPAGAVDARERIVLPAAARNLVLAEMRQMMESNSGVLAALSECDMAAAAQAARASGMAAAVDVDRAVRVLLPASFVQLGMETHLGFDALAERLEQPVDQQTALTELATLTQKCVACHATYRADEAP